MEINTNKYLNNSPKSDSDFYKNEVDILASKINDNTIRNIGVVAPYGAGKSSLIKTYKDENSKKPRRSKKKIIEISLLDLSYKKDEKEAGDKKEPETNISDSLLEKSILEQMFFKIDKWELPLSRIERIHNRFWISLLKSLLIIFTVVCVLLSILEFNHVLPNSDGNNFYIFSGLSVLFALITITTFIFSSNISKISIRNIEVEFSKINNGSVLNLFLDEIVYYFKETKTDVVVFEDIDRFESINLFTKLREINQVINDNKRINRKVTFVYCVSDEFFASASDRAKFFDFIISLLPVLNPKNVTDHILKAVGSEQLSDLFIQRISRFIVEKRILNNIVNDYFFFQQSLKFDGTIEKNEKLFAMMTYKNLCFSDYVELQKGEGELVKLFNEKKANLIKQNVESLQNKIEEINKNIKESDNNKYVINNINKLKDIISGIMAKKGNSSASVPAGYLDINSIETFKDIKTGIYMTISVFVNSYTYQNRFNAFKYMDINAITETLNQSPYEIEQQIKGEYQKHLYDEKKALNTKVLSISGMNIKKLLALNPDIDNKTLFSDNNFLSFAVRNGYIDESYFIYVGQTNSKIDSTFIDNVVSDKAQNVEQHLDSCELIIDLLNSDEFANKSILNYSLIHFMFTNNVDLNKKSILIGYLASGDKEAVQFIADYCSRGYEYSSLLVELMKKNVNIVNELIQTNKLTKAQVCNILLLLFINKNEIKIEQLENKEKIADIIRNYDNVLEAFLPFANDYDIIEFLNTFNVDKIVNIDYADSVDEHWERLLSKIVAGCKFDINFINIKTISLYYLKHNSINVSSLLNCDKSIGNYFKDDICTTVSEIVNNVEQLNEENDTVVYVLSNSDIDDLTKTSFASKLANDVDYNKGFDSNICSFLLNNSKLSKKWSNLALMLVDGVANKDDLFDFVKENNDAFLDKLNDMNLIKFVFNECSFDNESIRINLVNYVDTLITPDDINEDNICCLLIEKGKIEVSKDNLLRCKNKINSLIKMLSINQSLVEFAKTLSLDCSAINEILNSSSVIPETKLKLIKDYENTIRENTNNEELCKNVSIVFCESRSFVFDPESMSNLLKNGGLSSEIYNSLIDLCFNLFDDSNSVLFLKIMQPELFEYLIQNLDSQPKIKTIEFENNIFIKSLVKKGIISSVRKSKTNTTLNVSGLLEVLNK